MALEGISIIDRILIKNNKAADQCTFEECFDKDLIILLGNPGEGKSTLFELMAKRESAIFVPVRSFVKKPLSQFQGKILYLDGLDEERGTQASGTGVLAEVCRRLHELAPGKFRVSCRFADWHGELALNDFKEISNAHDSTVILQLKPFSNDDLRKLLVKAQIDPNDFMEEAERKGILDLLRTPLNFHLIVGIIRSAGSWPSTKTELYEKAVTKLLDEKNPSQRVHQAPYSLLQLAEQSEELCALQMISNISGFSFGTAEPTEDFPSFREIVRDGGLAKAALSTGIFFSEDGQTSAPYHRSIAEYLAARYLARQIRGGIPVRRFLALITGPDGGLLTEFRGLGGWLATLSPDSVETLIRRDPMGIVAYGDVAAMSAHCRALLLQSIEAEAEKDPYLRLHHWDPNLYAPLACKAMAGLISEKLSTYHRSFGFTCCLLDAISKGEKLPELQKEVSLILNDPQAHELHPKALEALIHIGATPEELTALLDLIARDKFYDPMMELRGILLSHLYPMTIDESRLAAYLVEPPPSFSGAYGLFLIELSENPREERLSQLMDGIACHYDPSSISSYSVGSIFAKVLEKAISTHGHQVNLDRLMRWLSFAQTDYEHTWIPSDSQSAIKKWLHLNPTILTNLYDHWISTSEGTNLLPSWNHFRNAILEAEPENFLGFLLKRLEQTSRLEMKSFLFGRLIDQCFSQRPEGSFTFAELFEISERHPDLKDKLIAMSMSDIPERRQKYNQKQREADKKRERQLAHTRAELKRELDSIEAGENLSALIFLADHYRGDISGSDDDATGIERIKPFFLNDGDVLRSLFGFMALVERHGNLLNPVECGKSSADRKILRAVFPFRIGMNLLWQQRPDCITHLPKESVRAALSCALAYGRLHKLPWLQALIDCHRIDVLEATVDYLRPILKAKAAKIELGNIESSPQFEAIKVDLVMHLFGEFESFHAEWFEILLKIAVEKNMDISPFLPGWERNLADADVGRFHLMAAKFLLGLESDICLGESSMQKNHAAVICQFIESLIEKRSDLKKQLTLLTTIVKTFGPIFSMEDMEFHGPYINDEYKSARFVQWAMESLAKLTSPDALSALGSIKCMDTLGSWHPLLKHLASNQLRLYRDESHIYPVLTQVAQTFSNGHPANAADLHAMVTEHLISLAYEYKSGNANRKLIFWNLKDGKPDAPLTENVCRDRLMHDLKQKIESLGVSIEPEGNYADNKRADLKAIYRGGLNIPVEIKRHHHRELWSALENQLISRYCIDPGASGYGVFLVFWFGLKVSSPPSPPSGYSPPKSADDMRAILERRIPHEYRNRVSVVVFDVSGHEKV